MKILEKSIEYLNLSQLEARFMMSHNLEMSIWAHDFLIRNESPFVSQKIHERRVHLQSMNKKSVIRLANKIQSTVKWHASNTYSPFLSWTSPEIHLQEIYVRAR